MITVVTGHEGGLGARLMTDLPGEAVGISGETIRKGKPAIDEEIAKILHFRGDINRVVNNFGINHLSWIGNTPSADEDIYKCNVMGPYWIIDSLVSQNQKCRVVNVASATYRTPQRCTSLYCASKAALVHMTRVMARELAPKGWVLNCIAPGLMPETSMAALTEKQVLELRGWTKEQADSYATNLIPMGRTTSTFEVADAIRKIFELPDYINGTVIDMMGGA